MDVRHLRRAASCLDLTFARSMKFSIALLLLVVTGLLAAAPAANEPLFDWSDWEKFRGTVRHPSGAFKPADVARARENLQQYPWAKNYADTLERTARASVGKLTADYLAAMIPITTPGDSKFTPCPACRDARQPLHPHGQWSWSATTPERLTCAVCSTTFPNDKYPESVVLETSWGRPQQLTFCGGEPFVIFSYKTGRPSFSGNIRARKVAYMAGLCRTLAEAFLLSGKIEYAQAVRAMLLRFAEVYPGWLVHTGYGEYADLDPRVGAQFINQLPAPELCPPPNKPDRKLHTGYWTAGRATGGGQESGFVRKMVEAYDFTCDAKASSGAALYTDGDRRVIERDLLLEGSLLLVADKQINNKSVGNRTAAALVGLCVGHPGLVRFGWDGFQQTVDDWFLPDGTTSESPAYALMTLSNIWDLPQALRGYAEPQDYRGPDGRARAAADLYHGTAYQQVWENCFKGLQGNLTYPAFADSYRTSALSSHFVELMVANYPEHPEYLALLKELCGPALERGHAALALYYREPGLERKPAPPITLPDWCPPELRIGHMRSGADGREGLLLLSASRWGGHHHQDSLNLTYWKNGHEVLSDLGYLWDHPQKHQTSRTFAHNTVLLDENEQRTKDRGGEVAFFRASQHVKVMEASSQAYEAAGVYRRTSALVDHGEGRSYVVDFFRVSGGAKQDFVYHASAAKCEIAGAEPQAAREQLYDLRSVRTFAGAHVWRATWDVGDGATCIAWNIGQAGERVFVGDGWGQRDWRNSDVGATLPYIVRRTEGASPKTFVTVWESCERGRPFVRSVTLHAPGVVAVETASGTDYILSQLEPATVPIPAAGSAVRLSGRFAVASLQGGRIAWEFNESGTQR